MSTFGTRIPDCRSSRMANSYTHESPIRTVGSLGRWSNAPPVAFCICFDIILVDEAYVCGGDQASLGSIK